MSDREAGCLRPVMWIHITGFFYAPQPISPHYYIMRQPPVETQNLASPE